MSDTINQAWINITKEANKMSPAQYMNRPELFCQKTISRSWETKIAMPNSDGESMVNVEFLMSKGKSEVLSVSINDKEFDADLIFIKMPDEKLISLTNYFQDLINEAELSFEVDHEDISDDTDQVSMKSWYNKGVL